MKKITLFIASLFLFANCSNSEAEFDATGNFEADEIIVSSEANGEIQKWELQEGSSVTEGQVLALIDTTALHLQKRQLMAQIAVVESHTQGVAQQTAALRATLGNLYYEEKRLKKLLAANAATRKQIDDINFQIIHTKEQLVALQDKLEDANESVRREVRALELQIEQIDLKIDKAVVQSPIAGRILQTYSFKGELAAAGKPLFKVAALDPIYLRAYVSGDQLAQIKLDMPVQVLTDNGDGDMHQAEGRISWISDQSEFTPKSIQTKDERANRVYAIKVRLPNDGRYKIGMYGEVKWTD